MRRFLTSRPLAENAAWAAGSLILAVLIWVAATTEQNPVIADPFPEPIGIQIEIDDGMIITNNPTLTTEVFLRTQQTVWDVLESDDLTVRADLTGLSPGTYTVELAVEVATARRVVVEDWRPRQITVAIDRAAELLVPVNPDILSEPPTGFEATEITFDRNQVLVTGPASLVERAVSANVRLRLRDERTLFSEEMRVWPVDRDGNIITGVTLSPENVNVTVNIQPDEGFREVFITPNIPDEPPEGYVIQSITYEPQTILVSGRPSALEQLPGTILTEPVSLANQTHSFSRTVSVVLPPGVFLATDQPITVNIEIEALPGSRNFEQLPVEIRGQDPARVTLVPSEVSLFITGPAAILNTLTPDDIGILADLTDLPPGSHQVPLQVIITREGLESATISALPAVLDVQIAAPDNLPLPDGTPTPARDD